MSRRGFLALALVVGCTKTTAPTGDGFDRRALLEGVANNAILPVYREVQAESAALSAATTAWANAPTSSTARAAATEAWKATMGAWEQAEVFQVGPAGQSGRVLGGQDLRDEIYSWPTTSPCRIDQEIVANQFEQPGFFDSRRVNSYGLDGLEYLLFYDGADNACSAVLAINADGEWDVLDPSERTVRRAGLAAAVAARVEADITRLIDAWESGFLADFIQPGDDGSAYRNERQAVNDLFAALFYVELITKDQKLARPMGLHPDCAGERCPEDLEFQFSGFSRAAVANNLIGFQKGYTAGEGVGFEDYLRALDATDVADTMSMRTQAAIDVAGAGPDFHELLQTGVAEMQPTHTAVKTLTDVLKSQFVSILNLDVPQEGAGDND